MNMNTSVYLIQNGRKKNWPMQEVASFLSVHDAVRWMIQQSKEAPRGTIYAAIRGSAIETFVRS